MARELETYERDILDEIHRKGWEVYDSTDAHTREEAEESIKRGPTKGLEVGKRYVLLPKTASPTNPRIVFNALEKVAIKLNRETPTILIREERFPWTGFIPKSDCIKVNTNRGHFISYANFLTSIDSILQI